MVNFPSTFDVLSNPTSTSDVVTISHSSQHGVANDILEAIEAKLGVGGTTIGQAPSTDTVLIGRAGGGSSWGKVNSSMLVGGTTANTLLGTVDGTNVGWVKASTAMISSGSTGTVLLTSTAGGVDWAKVGAGHRAGGSSFTVYHVSSSTAQGTLGKITHQFMTVPSCRIWNNAAQGFNPSSANPVSFNVNRWDTDNMHSTVTNPSRITINTPGKYACGGEVSFASTITGYRLLWIQHNGSTIIVNDWRDAAITGVQTRITLSTPYQFSSGDYIELYIQHSAASTLAVESVADYTPIFWAYMIST